MKEGTNVPGTIDAPMSWDDLGRKFDDCAAASRTTLSADEVNHVKALARNLETADDATDLIRALA